jgi:hypothetical protein
MAVQVMSAGMEVMEAVGDFLVLLAFLEIQVFQETVMAQAEAAEAAEAGIQAAGEMAVLEAMAQVEAEAEAVQPHKGWAVLEAVDLLYFGFLRGMRDESSYNR